MPIPARRRTVRRGAVAAAAATGLALVLAGCVGAPAATPTPSPADTPAPIFASDEEALAAATEAYGGFERVSQTIASESGSSPGRIGDVATSRYTPELLEEFQTYEDLGIHTVGQSTLDSFELVEQTSADGVATVVIYVCRDVSDVRVIDATGNDVTPADRDERAPLVATLVSEESEHLLVDQVELWAGKDFC
jgi:hypothetical protein